MNDKTVNQKPRLVYLVTSSLSVEFLRGQLSYMRRRGFEVLLVSSPGVELERAEEEEGITTIALPMEREIRPEKDLIAVLRLIRLCRSLRPDVVVAGTPKAGLFGMLASRLTRVPVRIYMQHGLRLETARGLKRWILRRAERLACACATRIVCVSKSLREKTLQLRLASKQKATVLANGSANGVDVNRFAATPRLRQKAATVRAHMDIPRHAPVVGFVGRLTRDKGIEDLLGVFHHVASKMPETRLLLVGDFEPGDPVPDRCVRELKSHPQIAITGFVEDPAAHYHAMDVLAFPSHREGLGMVPLEAAASALPVAGFRATGTVDSVADGVTGTLVPTGDRTTLADTILRYLKAPELRLERGKAGRKRVSQQFRRETVWDAFYQECISLMRGAGLVVEDEANGAAMRRQKRLSRTKRCFDATAAALGLLLSLPLLGIIALAVRATLGRPILFRQRRPGLLERPFAIYKFRTMRDLRDEHGELLPEDQRLTRLGRFLRRTSLDELPELMNVLRGEMSLVGPRPLTMQYLDRYTPEQARRHEVRPGITGLAQVNGRDDLSWEEKFRKDVWYVDNRSFLLDIRILAKTIWNVFFVRDVNETVCKVEFGR